MISHRNISMMVTIILLPFFLFHWMLPFLSHIYPDQDYMAMFALLQTEYLFALKTGTFPLNIVWSQVQNNQWGCVFNPFLYIAEMVPGFSTGRSLDCVLFLQMVLLGITHLALFRLLRKMLFPVSIAFFLSLITVYSPRLLLSFSVGGAAHVWTTYILLCVAIGFYGLDHSGYSGPLAIIGLSYLLISSGYTQETYFALLGTGLFTLSFPFLLNAILPDRPATGKTMAFFWRHTAVFCLIGTLLSAAFILPFMLDNFKEVALSSQAYEKACQFSSSPSELISNFFSPFRASPSGLLGSSPLLLAAMIIPVSVLCRARIPVIIWVLWGTSCFLMICMLGDNTPVHYYVWKYLPLYSATRYVNRVSMILPVLLMLLLIWLFKSVPANQVSIKTIKASPLSVLTTVALLATIFYACFMIKPVETLQPSLTRMNLEIIPGWVEPLLLISGLVILVVVTVHGLRTKPSVKQWTGFVLCLLTCLQLVVFFRYAPLTRKKLETRDIRTFTQYKEQKRQHTDLFLGNYILGFEKILFPGYAVRQLEKAGPQPLLAKIYEKHINVTDIEEAYQILSRGKKEDVLVVAGYPGGNDVNATSPPGEADVMPASVRLTYNSSNRLVFEARANSPSFFMFAYHRTGHWQAFVNGKSAASYYADGNAHAVKIPAGRSTVEFRYRSSAAFAGMLISCLTLAGIGLFYGVFRTRGPVGYALAVMSLICGGSLFCLWYSSLYAGENLGTHYLWQAPDRNAPRNMAYGKPVRASLPPFGPLRLNLMHDARFAVDGGHSFASCFSTGTQTSPWLEIDLLHPQPVGSIVLYADLQGLETNNIVWYTQDSVKIAREYDFLIFEKSPVAFNLPPLTISVSADHTHWETTQLHGLIKGKPLTIRPQNPLTARYIRITASGECRLCLNEVEIYPPGYASDKEPLDLCPDR